MYIAVDVMAIECGNGVHDGDDAPEECDYVSYSSVSYVDRDAAFEGNPGVVLGVDLMRAHDMNPVNGVFLVELRFTVESATLTSIEPKYHRWVLDELFNEFSGSEENWNL
jgi:hypothetical protein